MIYGCFFEVQVIVSFVVVIGYDSYIFDFFLVLVSVQIDIDMVVILLCYDFNWELLVLQVV